MVHADDGGIRASDIDRATVASLIDQAYANGELDDAEHAERLHAAVTAKTRADLTRLVVDLQVEMPHFAVPRSVPVAAPATRSRSAGAIGIGAGVVVLGVIAAAVLLFEHGSGGHGAAPTAQSTDTAQPTDVTQPTDPGQSAATDGVAPPARGSVSRGALTNAIRSDFTGDEGHTPDSVSCPTALPGVVGASVPCTITDRGNTYPVTVSVVSLHGTNVTYNVSIADLP
jgi:hypothetical protein